MDDIDLNFFSIPEFCDIDGDNDYDMFIGSYSGGIYYFENTGNQLFIVDHFYMYQYALTAKKDRKIQDEYFILYKDQNNEFCAR